jgi:hypothetical protein
MQPTDRSLDSPVLRGFRLTHDLNPDGSHREAAVSIDAHSLPAVPKAEPPQNPSRNPSSTTPVPGAENAGNLETPEIKGFRLPEETDVTREEAVSFAAPKPTSHPGAPNPLNPPNASSSRRLKSPPAELKRGAGTTSPVLKGFRLGSDGNAKTSGREPAVSFEGQSAPPADNAFPGSSAPSPNPPSKLRQPDAATTNPVGSKPKAGRSNSLNSAPNPAPNQTPKTPVGSKTGQERGSPVLKGFRLADDSSIGRDAAVSFDAPQFPAVVSPHRRLPTEEPEPGSEVGLSIVLGPDSTQTPQTRSSFSSPTYQNPGSTLAIPVLNPGSSSPAAWSIFHRGQGQGVLPRSRLTWNDVISRASLEGGDDVGGAGGSARNDVGDDVSDAGNAVEAEGGDVIGGASLDLLTSEHVTNGADRSVRDSSGSDVSTAGEDTEVGEAHIIEGTTLGDFQNEHDVSKPGGKKHGREGVSETSEDSGEESKDDVDGTEESTGEVCKRVVMESSDVIEGFGKRKAEGDVAKSGRMTVSSSGESGGLSGRLGAEDGVLGRAQGPFLGGSEISINPEGGSGGIEESRMDGAGESRGERKEEGRTEWEQGSRVGLAEGNGTEWEEGSRTKPPERNVKDQSRTERNSSEQTEGASVDTNGREQNAWKDSHEDVNEPAISAARAFSPERKAHVSQQDTKAHSSEEGVSRSPSFSRLPSFSDGSEIVSAAKAFSSKGKGLSRLAAKGTLEARKAVRFKKSDFETPESQGLGEKKLNSSGNPSYRDPNSEILPSAEEGRVPDLAGEGVSDQLSERTSVDAGKQEESFIRDSAEGPIEEDGSQRKASSFKGRAVLESAARRVAEEAEPMEAIQEGEGRASGSGNRSGNEDLSKSRAVEESEGARVIESKQSRGSSGSRTASREALKGASKAAARERLGVEQSEAPRGSRQVVKGALMPALRKESERAESRGSERAESRGSERAESRGSERAESRGSERAESRDSERAESRGSERAESRGSERAESREAERADSRESERAESRGSERAESRGSERADFRGSERAESRESEKAESRESDREESRESERSRGARDSRSASGQAFEGASKPMPMEKFERASAVDSKQSGGASGSPSAGRSALEGAVTAVSPKASAQEEENCAPGTVNRTLGPLKCDAVEDSERARMEQSTGRPVSTSDVSKVLHPGAVVTSPTKRQPAQKATPRPQESSDANPKAGPKQSLNPQPVESPKSVESGLGGNPVTSDALSLLVAQYKESPPHKLPSDLNPSQAQQNPEPLHQPSVSSPPSVKTNPSPVKTTRPVSEGQRKGPSRAPGSRSPPTSERPKVSDNRTGADSPRASGNPQLLINLNSAGPSSGAGAPTPIRPPIEGSSPASKVPADLDAGTVADSLRASQSPLLSVSPRIRDNPRGGRKVTSRNPPPPSSPTKSDSLPVSETLSNSDRALADSYLLSQPYQPGTFGEPSRPTSGGRPLSAERPPTAEADGRYTYSERPMSAERWVAPSEPETVQPLDSRSDNPPQNPPPNPGDLVQSEFVMGPHFFPLGMPPPVGHVSAPHWPLVQGAEGHFSAPPAAGSVRSGPVNPPGYPPGYPPFFEPHQQLLAQYMQQYPGFSFPPGGLGNPLSNPRQGGNSQYLLFHGGNSGFSLLPGGLVHPVLNPTAEAGLQHLGASPALRNPPGYWQTVPNSLTQLQDFSNLSNPLSQSQNLPNPFGLNPFPNPALQYSPFPNPYFSYGVPPQYYPAPPLAFPFGAGLPSQLPQFGVPGTSQGAVSASVSGPPQQPRSVGSQEFANGREQLPEPRSEKGGATAVRSNLLKARDIAVQVGVLERGKYLVGKLRCQKRLKI